MIDNGNNVINELPFCQFCLWRYQLLLLLVRRFWRDRQATDDLLLLLVLDKGGDEIKGYWWWIGLGIRVLWFLIFVMFKFDEKINNFQNFIE